MAVQCKVVDHLAALRAHLVVRDADNKLRSAAESKSAEVVLRLFQELSKKDRKDIFANLAVEMAQYGLTQSGSRKKPVATMCRNG